MPRPTFVFAAAVAAALALSSARAGSGPGGCDDLTDIAETPMVDFPSQIQPILDSCTSCHGETGPAGLDLRSGESYDNLVGVVSTTNPDRLRVAPFDPETSALFLAVSCDAPGGPGFRMPGTERPQRALIRDWIAQGARPETAEPVSVSVTSRWTVGAMVIMLMLLAGFHLRRNESV